MAKTAEILGVRELNEDILKKHLKKILVPEHNRLIYVFNDGHSQEVYWQNPSRRESWTEEMKQLARERSRHE